MELAARHFQRKSRLCLSFALAPISSVLVELFDPDLLRVLRLQHLIAAECAAVALAAICVHFCMHSELGCAQTALCQPCAHTKGERSTAHRPPLCSAPGSPDAIWRARHPGSENYFPTDAASLLNCGVRAAGTLIRIPACGDIPTECLHASHTRQMCIRASHPCWTLWRHDAAVTLQPFFSYAAYI